MDLTQKTRDIIRTLFPPSQIEGVEHLLTSKCSNNVPGCRDWNKEHLERVWISVLKLSEGDLDKLNTAVTLANTDYRDLFMSAGFGHDPEAHTVWKP